MEQQQRNPNDPTATAPDSVAETVPSAAKEAGKSGPNAADPPRAAQKSEGDEDLDSTLDADEGADAFETREDAAQKGREDVPERRDEDIITLDTPD